MSGKKKEKTGKGRSIAVMVILVILAICGVLVGISFNSGGSTPAANRIEQWLGLYADSADAHFDFEMYSDNVFEQLDGGLILASSAQIQSFDARGEPLVSRNSGVTDPVISVKGKYAAVWSVGGEDIYLVNEGKITTIRYSETAAGSHPLVSVKVSADGKVAAVTEESGYKGAVSVYSADGSPVYRVYIGSGYPLDAAISPDGSELAVLMLTVDGSRLSLYSLSDENELNAWESEEIFYSVDYLSAGTLCTVSSQSAVFHSYSLRSQNRYDFYGEYLKDYDSSGDGYIVLLLGKYKVGGSSHLITLDSSGTVLGSIEDGAEPMGISASGKYISVLYGDKNVIYDNRLAESGSVSDTDSVNITLARSDGSIIMVSGGEAIIYKP